MGAAKAHQRNYIQGGTFGRDRKRRGRALPQSTKDLQFFDVGTKKTAEVQGEEIAQRSALVAAIQSKARDMDYKAAFQSVVEEVAYTWFNRMAAIRFMGGQRLSARPHPCAFL